MAKWFVTIEGREYGPLSAAELKRAVAKGRVTAETPVRMEGMDSRVPAARVKGLFAAAKDKTAEITPPPKKDETETTSDDGEELKLAETNWSPPVATPGDELQQPPAAKTKQKKTARDAIASQLVGDGRGDCPFTAGQFHDCLYDRRTF